MRQPQLVRSDLIAPSPRRGVFFLASDSVAELAFAFLNSFRTFNADVPLCLIPFDDDIAGLRALSSQYQFVMYEDRELLRRCDSIGESLHRRRVGHYRKLAAWHGPFDEFIYIDVDTVVLADVDFVWAHLQTYDVITSHSDSDELAQWV